MTAEVYDAYRIYLDKRSCAYDNYLQQDIFEGGSGVYLKVGRDKELSMHFW